MGHVNLNKYSLMNFHFVDIATNAAWDSNARGCVINTREAKCFSFRKKKSFRFSWNANHVKCVLGGMVINERDDRI